MQSIAKARFDSGAIVSLDESRNASLPYATYTQNTTTGSRSPVERFGSIHDAVLGFARRCAEELNRKARTERVA